MIPVDRLGQELGSAFPTGRVLRVIDECITRYELRLDSFVVLTEAATGYYRVTPIIAARAGAAATIAVARDNSFGSAATALAQVHDLAAAAGVSQLIEVVTTPASAVAGRAQIITNLGAVRPIDAELVRQLSPTAVVSLMFGARDVRPADLDVDALRRAGVPLCGVDEEKIDLFRWTGQRIAWWLTEVGIEICGSRLLLWGDDAPARRVAGWLAGAGAQVIRHAARCSPPTEQLRGLDAVVLMGDQARITDDGLTPVELAVLAPGAAILEYRGAVQRERCRELGLIVFPTTAPRAGHVARTIGEILYAPVIELHTAGLKVAELLARGRQRGLSPAECERLACLQGPGEPIVSAVPASGCPV